MKNSNDGAELDLGIVPSKDEDKCCPAPCGMGDSDKERYPEVEFRGAHADLFRNKYGNCAPGDVYLFGTPGGGVEMRVKSSSDGESEYEKRIVFCMTKIIGDVVEEEAAEEKEEKPEKPQRRVAGKKETAGAY